ncbi:MAG: gamma-glutamyl-gamma-aminobutyrate hydrolase family protein [Acidobacteria bacterium]|nr:gamma-glutamyl-gamma-aminobutyrate hydrolase family protein [Acidobacteriota bacterium]MCL5288508.1 gamma-glutamyl-gamma-aminobutyrate hydrolase family protein [Acidobacteriota bacterium]
MSTGSRPLIGVPFRSLREEDDPSARDKIEPYLRAVEAAGGHAAEISLRLPLEKLVAWAGAFDAILLTGSPADVDPAWYHAERRAACGESDPYREQTDFALLDCAFAAGKPVLAICYGVQSLNVYLGGSLVQDIASEKQNPLAHAWEGRTNGAPEPHHDVAIAPGSRLAQLAGATTARVNSSHHQALDRLGRGMRVVARAPDGVIEAVECVEDVSAHVGTDFSLPRADAKGPPSRTGAEPWVIGVQWHPERMTSDALAQSLFHEFVAAAKTQVVGSRF